MAEKKKSGSKSKKAAAKKPAAKKSAKTAAKKAAPKKAAKKPEPKEAAPKPSKGKAKQPEVAAGVEARALARYVRISPQKARLVIDLIRGREVGPALTTLRFARQRAAGPIEKVLRSAIANAEQKDENVDVDRLFVKHAVVNEGFRYKRIRPRARGTADVYYHRTSHIEIAVAEKKRAAATA
jgi:large subunit ribosomal protein L22